MMSSLRPFAFWPLAILLVALPAAISGFITARAETTASKRVVELRGEWERAGAGFSCKLPVPKKLQSVDPYVLSRACQHLGPFVVGDDAKAVTMALGAAHRTLPQPDGRIAWLYFLEQEEQHPYLVITIAKRRIAVLQVTGTAAAKGYGFNHIELGMPSEALLQNFGKPNHVEPSEEKDTELWSYRPWPFSFEVHRGHVSSIRLAEP